MKYLLGGLAILGLFTLISVIISLLLWPSSYDTPLKVWGLAGLAIVATAAVVSGIKDAKDLVRDLFSSNPNHNKESRGKHFSKQIVLGSENVKQKQKTIGSSVASQQTFFSKDVEQEQISQTPEEANQEPNNGDVER